MSSKKQIALNVVSDQVAKCVQCSRLVSWREEVSVIKRAAYKNDTYWGRGVPGFGDPNAQIMVVGLAPGAHGANRTGRMFTGDRSGDWLYGALHRAGLANQANSSSTDDGLELSGVYITAPVKCVPPDNKPTIVERDTCSTFFDQEIEILDPKVFVALGKFAFDILQRKFDVSPRVKFSHGALIESEIDGGFVYILASYHVSQQNTSTKKLTVEMLDQIFDTALGLMIR